MADFEYHLERNLFDLQRELFYGLYRPGPYRNFTIYEPKRRLVSAAPFRDRVVHHALCRVIEPIWERRFIHDSYACRVGKGTHRALARCQQFVRQYPYVLQCDIRKYFPCVDHAILLELLQRKIGDLDTLDLCAHILRSGTIIRSTRVRPTVTTTCHAIATSITAFGVWWCRQSSHRPRCRSFTDGRLVPQRG